MTILDWVLIMNAAFLCGLSVAVFSRYVMSKRLLHIAMVASGHCGITATLSAAMIWHVFVSRYETFFMFFVAGLFLWCDVGVILVLLDKKKRLI